MMYGSKIDNLKILQEHNINVPPFIVIQGKKNIQVEPTHNQLLDLNKLSNNLQKTLNFDFIQNIKIPTYKQYSVRSSCNLEDGDNTSFAGLFDTFLYVDKKDVKEYIKKCFNSVYNTNVLLYMKNNNLQISELQMNVLVQEMIDADTSGVIFTSNPQGILNESVISIAEGIGENVVQDKGECTNYYYNITDKKYYYEGEKNLLTEEKINELMGIVNKIKNIFGEHLDIEFAIKNDVIYILQTRKITTNNNTNPLILDNSNIVESYPNISLPLTISFVNSIYSGIFHSVSSRVLTDKETLEKYKDVFHQMTGAVNGRMYYKISNWYTVIKFLPMNKKIIPIWQEMLGVQTKAYDEKKVVLSKKVRLKTYINSLKSLIYSQKLMTLLNKEFEDVEAYFYKNFNTNLTTSEVLSLYSTIKTKLLANWDITLLNDMYTFIFVGLLKRHLIKNNSESEINNYISGISNIESIKPIQEMINLAYKKESYSEESFEQSKQEYIQMYGDRTIEELKLETKTFRTNPELLDLKIDEYRSDKDKLETLYESINNKKNITIQNHGFITNVLMRKCISGIKNRETSRLNRTRIFGMVRAMFLQIAKDFKQKELIDEIYDIFYLTIDEISLLQFDEKVKIEKEKTSVKHLINKRKDQYKMFEMIPTYSRLIFEENEFDKTINNAILHKKTTNQTEFIGTPCSDGIITAEAVVVKNANENIDTKNKIIITKMTDPGWVFMISTASGIISEKGSLLSHTAIISRELKIPAVVNIPNIIDYIKTGDIVSLNGKTGEISIKERKKVK